MIRKQHPKGLKTKLKESTGVHKIREALFINVDVLHIDWGGAQNAWVLQVGLIVVRTKP